MFIIYIILQLLDKDITKAHSNYYFRLHVRPNKEGNPLPYTSNHSEQVEKLKPVQEILSEEIVNDRYDVKKLF